MGHTFKESREELYAGVADPSAFAQPALLSPPGPERGAPRDTVTQTLKERREELNSGVVTTPIPVATESPSRLPRPPPKRKRKTAAEKFGPPRQAVERAAYTVDEFAWAHGFSRAAYYKMRARGEGPDEFRVGKRVLISEEAAARWRKQRTQSARQPAAQPGQQP